ncbi:hypothetical protein [Pectinatus frisingensis]|nr:hypothetical protein [Pectinatus frisingensis]
MEIKRTATPQQLTCAFGVIDKPSNAAQELLFVRQIGFLFLTVRN